MSFFIFIEDKYVMTVADGISHTMILHLQSHVNVEHNLSIMEPVYKGHPRCEAKVATAKR